MNEDDIERILQAAGQRERVPAEVENAARERLRVEWRAAVAEHRDRRRMRIGFGMAAGLLAAAIGAWFTTWQPDRANGPAATIAVALNDVRIQEHWWRGWQPAAAGTELSAGEAVETGANGRAGVRLPGNAYARLDHDTLIRLASTDQLVLERGAVYVDAGQDASSDSDLVVETPTGVVRHVGTQYEVRLSGQETRLRVREGLVEWRSHDGAITNGRAGEELTVGARGLVRRAESAPYGESWDWIATTTPAVDVEGRPLAEFLAWVGRELGREVVYATPEVSREAETIVVHGSVSGLTPEQALHAVLATTTVRGGLDEGRILVSEDR
jgi:ferric-dicitrate binding protein FerR (iron transport regulator)